jgi:O-antigen ligase
VRTVFAAVLVVAVAAGVAAAWAGKGSPVALARRGWHGFVAPPAPAQSNLNSRLFSLSGEGRIQSWHAALREFESAPAGGTGAGTFENWWLQHRATADQRRDAHSLYLETLGELGIVGLLLLAVTIAVPLVAGIRRRRSFAVAAFACWAVHAAADWDWELSAVTLLAFACAVACCVDTSGARSLPVRVRAALGVALAAVAAFAVVVIVGNAAVAHSEAALRAGNDGEADLQARRAQRWAPWSAEPWLIRGQIQVRAQDVADAKASLEQAAALEPANYLVWYALAGVEQGPARSRAAAAVVRLNPMSQEAQEMRKVLRRSAGTGG